MGDPVVGEAIAEVLPLVDPVDPAEAGVEVADSVDPSVAKAEAPPVVDSVYPK